jgi:malate synthase
MADFEDSSSPTWKNLVEGQINLKDAVRGTITYINPANRKEYRLQDKGSRAKLFVRPRGWHLNEAHVTVNGRVASGSLFDFSLFFYHNVHECIKQGSGVYLYLPKVKTFFLYRFFNYKSPHLFSYSFSLPYHERFLQLESYLEARLWNDVFVAAQNYLGVPIGTIRATVLLETITAAFEMEEILFELRDHSIGLNCGRWDYLFSYIKKFKLHTDKIVPDRSHLTMTTPLMKAYVTRLIHVCHKRGTFAMGGMSAAIPIRNNPTANAAAIRKIEEDKLREVMAGHDGTWVAHPDLVAVARGIFDANMRGPNQIDCAPALEGARVTETELLELPIIPKSKAITSDGLNKGIAIVLAYTEAWLRGVGCIPLNNAMEDAATAEISRVQIWQWQFHQVPSEDDGVPITAERVRRLVHQHVVQEMASSKEGSQWLLAGKLVSDMLTKAILDDFLTSVLYPHILTTCYEKVTSNL